MRIRTLHRDERGAVLTEFGLLLVPLCILLMGLLDLGYMMYMRSVLQGALNDVARQATVENPDFGGEGSLDEQIDAAIKGRLTAIAKSATFDIDKAHYDSFSNVGRPEKLVTDVNGNGRYDDGDCYEDINGNGSYDDQASRTGIGGADDVSIYTVRVTMTRMFPIAPLIGLDPDYQMEATTAIRNQPYNTQIIPTPPTVCTSA